MKMNFLSSANQSCVRASFQTRESAGTGTRCELAFPSRGTPGALRPGAILLTAVLLFHAVGAFAETESELMAVLQSSAGPVQKAEACAKLRLVGTAKSVSALAPLLTEERVSQAARFALEGINAPEATAALRDALGKTSGLLQAGVMDSLGWKRDAASVALLVPFLADADATVASAAASALGRIGGNEAIAALDGQRSLASAAARPAVVEGLLRCADRLLAEGQADKARTIYESLLTPAEPEHIRVAAYAGRIRAASNEGFALVRSALEAGDTTAQTAALQLANTFPGAEATKTISAALLRPSPALKVALLTLLQQRGDTSALPAVVAQTRSPDLAVRVAALTALGELGDAGLVPVLARAAASQTAAEQKAARQALVSLRRGDITAALVAQLSAAVPALQAELARALSARGERTAIPALLQLGRSDQPAVRKAALQALASLAGGSDSAALVQLLEDAKDAEAKAEVVGVFESLAERVSGKELDTEPIARGIASGRLENRAALLEGCAFFVDERLRSPFRAALKDADDGVRLAAARALCKTRDAALLPDLLEVARQASDAGLRGSAIEGIVRLATEENAGLSRPQRVETLAAAFALANRVEDKRMALSGLARVPDVNTLKLAEEAGSDPSVRTEAELACLQIAQKLGGSDFDAVEGVLTRLAASGGSASVKADAQGLLRKLNSGWLYAGPYRQVGKQCQELFDITFPPEQGAEGVTWRRAPGAAPTGRIGEVDLGGITGGDHCAVYLKTRLYVPIPQEVVFAIGTDDGIKLWVNRELVHANNAVRGLTPDEDKAKAKLRQGWNDLLAKITQHTLGCGMTLRVTEADGKDVPGTRIDPRGGMQPRDTGFKRLQLSDTFYTEGAYFGDFNRDGKLDVVAGPFWFEGPEFTRRHEYRPVKAYSPKEYSDNFLTYTDDLNGDGWTDIVCVPFPGKEGYWFENPASQAGHWKQHRYYDMVGNESPLWADVTGDGRAELIFCNEGYLGFAGPDPAQPTQPWVFRAVSGQDKRYQRFTHGVGIGDINRDGRRDIVEAAGWWAQPADARSGETWKFHPFQFAAAGAQMLIYDVDGDNAEDIITSWHCHEYGLVWWQQVRREGQPPDWKQHVILLPKPDLNSPALRFSQLHALDLVDMNGDGLKDIVTGKRFWAHGPAGDPEPNAPAVLYWFELRREAGGAVNYLPHLIDDDSGVGTQVATADLNGDGRPDVIVGNKKGIFVHLSQATRQASATGNQSP